MAVLTIRNIGDSIRSGLREQAAQHGCSMEEEARRILAQALEGTQTRLPFGAQLRQQLAGLGEFPIPPRNPVRVAPAFSVHAEKSK